MRKRLIIWDFDGVIADTEHLWLKIWQDLLNETFGLGWDFDKTNAAIGGMANKTKIDNFKKTGIDIGEDFLREIKRRDDATIAGGLELTPGVTEIFKLKTFAQCIATGGTLEKTEQKIKVLKLESYFPGAHIFTAEQVSHGKPEPDLFLFAAKEMGFSAGDCIVIEDSLVGLTAGLKAGMTTVAFIGAAMNRSQEYAAKAKALGVKHVFDNMADVKRFLESSE